MIRKGSGGTWTPEGGNSFFQSDNEAIGAGYSYMVRHGASGGSLREQIGKALGGELASDGTFYQFVQTAQYSTDGRMKGAGYVIEQKIDLVNGSSTASLSFPKEGNAWNDFLNSQFMKILIPGDVLTFDVSGTSVLGTIGGGSTYTLHIVMRGKDPGFYRTKTTFPCLVERDWKLIMV
ncbi:hypothetical protein LVD17_09880 [Fulvivirga ulvae]|uniref:hypothetical protein n=1 Tax=Fulvivirga ulvae TaxID=2904245 RepID=UPI001F1EA519|nr:hypothetical protein [Fulvivirga ulvae]UII34122.1 hypothetical protein LVD17_09880 [Fulvivirga ulvae]